MFLDRPPKSAAAIPQDHIIMKWLLAAAGLLMAVAAGHLFAAELRTAEQVRRLPAGQAEQSLPVRLKGVVTFFDRELFSQFVQDETAGIYLQDSPSTPTLIPGQRVEVEGVTSAGEYAPVV